MRVLLDAYFLGRPFGYGRVVGELCRALGRSPGFHEFVAAVTDEIDTDDLPQYPNVTYVPVPKTNFVNWEQRRIPALAKAMNCDVIHFPYNTCAAFTYKIPKVVTVHDLIFLSQTASFRNPKGKIALAYWKNNFRYLSRYANEVISVSETTARDLQTDLNLKSSTIYNTVDGFTSLPVTRAPGPRYLLHRGSTQEYRNTGRVIEAYRKIADTLPDVELRIIGVPTGPEIWNVSDLPRVQFLDRVTDLELANLYANASCVIAVSTAEGFCLPIIEAFGFDVPVVASGANPMCEIAGGAALIADPDSVDEIADRIEQILTIDGMAQSLIEKGRDRRAAFSSELIARQHVEVYQRAAASTAKVSKGSSLRREAASLANRHAGSVSSGRR